jgi:hypothetical protein
MMHSSCPGKMNLLFAVFSFLDLSQGSVVVLVLVFWINTASLKFLHLRRHWSQKSLSWCTTSRFQIDTRGCWTSSSSYLDWQRTATLDYLFLGWSYFALGTSWDYNHSFYQFIGAKVSRPRTRCVASHSSASLRRRNNTYEEDIASLYEILKGAKNPGLEQCRNAFAVHFCHYTALGKAEYTVF